MAEGKTPKNSPARIAANNRYAEKAYDRINLAVPKGQKQIIAEYAKKHGESVNAYIIRAVKAQMENE